jgi:hypothetical protein
MTDQIGAAISAPHARSDDLTATGAATETTAESNARTERDQPDAANPPWTTGVRDRPDDADAQVDPRRGIVVVARRTPRMLCQLTGKLRKISPRLPLRAGSKTSVVLAALLLGTSTAVTFNTSPARAGEPIKAPMQGKKWRGSIYNMVPTFPYVGVTAVFDVNKPLDVPSARWYYVLPQANLWVDCKYYHPSMGWRYRVTQIQGITDAGGPLDGYYEVQFLYVVLENGLKLADVDEICFPNGDKTPRPRSYSG